MHTFDIMQVGGHKLDSDSDDHHRGHRRGYDSSSSSDSEYTPHTPTHHWNHAHIRVCSHNVPEDEYCGSCARRKRVSLCNHGVQQDDFCFDCDSLLCRHGIPKENFCDGCDEREEVPYHPGEYGWNWTPSHWLVMGADWSCCVNEDPQAPGCEKKIRIKKNAKNLKPPVMQTKDKQAAPALPHNPWKTYTDKDTGKQYWHNEATGVTTWVCPSSVCVATLALPIAGTLAANAPVPVASHAAGYYSRSL